MNAVQRLVRSLVMLGALLGVFALHGLSFSAAEPAAVPVAQTAAVLQVDPHGVIERLEQVAMLAPDTFAVDAPDHQRGLVPCLAFAAAGSLLLLLSVGLFLRRERFGEVPRHATVTLAAPRRRVVSAAPDLARLCILRT